MTSPPKYLLSGHVLRVDALTLQHLGIVVFLVLELPFVVDSVHLGFGSHQPLNVGVGGLVVDEAPLFQVGHCPTPVVFGVNDLLGVVVRVVVKLPGGNALRLGQAVGLSAQPLGIGHFLAINFHLDLVAKAGIPQVSQSLHVAVPERLAVFAVELVNADAAQAPPL